MSQYYVNSSFSNALMSCGHTHDDKNHNNINIHITLKQWEGRFMDVRFQSKLFDDENEKKQQPRWLILLSNWFLAKCGNDGS